MKCGKWAVIDVFTIKVWWQIDKMQIIFKVITGSSSHAFWWVVLHCMEMLLDAGLVALESISPGKDVYYGTLRCRLSPSGKNYPRQWPAPWFLWQIFFHLFRAALSFPPRSVTGTSCYHFEYDHESIYTVAHHEIVFSMETFWSACMYRIYNNKTRCTLALEILARKEEPIVLI